MHANRSPQRGGTSLVLIPHAAAAKNRILFPLLLFGLNCFQTSYVRTMRAQYLRACFFLAYVNASTPPPPTNFQPPVPIADLAGHEPPGEAFFRDDDYNRARYGQYVSNSFKTENVTAPRLNIMNPLSKCDDGSYIFVAPRGNAVQVPTAAIYDASGSLVWTPTEHLGEVYNLQVQQYKGRPHLTYWTGNPDGGHGQGSHFIVDQQYKVVRNIAAADGHAADLHSFTILPGDTAIVTDYELAETDLASVLEQPSRTKRYMWDCTFQEYDLETGQIIFEWRATDHIALNESYATTEPANEEQPWDYFHINTVSKDAAGDYLISGRHTRSIIYISGKTGEVQWKLGGKANMFKDLSSGQATTFVGQHDAHWGEDHTFITLFDNRADWEFELERVSKGRRIKIDVENMTAKVDATFTHPEKIFAFSQGSFQTLPNGNVLLGYGFTGAFAEFSSDGTLLCDAYFQPASRFMSGDVQSYRNLKFNWTGLPDTKPKLAVENSIVYASWLGATETKSWRLQTSPSQTGPFVDIASYDKTGFETLLHLPEDLAVGRYFRIIAIDKHQQHLAISNVLDIGEDTAATMSLTTEGSGEEETSDEQLEEQTPNGPLETASLSMMELNVFLLGLVFGIMLIVLLYIIVVFWRPARRRVVRHLSTNSNEQFDSSDLHTAAIPMRPWAPLSSLRFPWQGRASYQPLPDDADKEADG